MIWQPDGVASCSGVGASDDADGDISHRVAVAHLNGRLDTRFPTADDSPFWIEYAVADVAGNAAARVATQVRVVCPPGQQRCPSGSDAELVDEPSVCSPEPRLCGFSRLLSETMGPRDEAIKAQRPEPNPLSIKLLGPNEAVVVPAGYDYRACDASTPLSTVCERGAVAHDAVDGDMTARVEVSSA